MTTQTYSPGLEGVIAGETKISNVNPERNSLVYWGYDIRDLVEHSSYEETAFLLLHGALPNQQELSAFNQTLLLERSVPEHVTSFINSKTHQNTHPMDLLRASVALLALEDPDVTSNSREANLRKAIRLTAKTATLVAATYRLKQGKAPIAPDKTLGHAANFLYMLSGEKPDTYMARVFDATLICYADHGFNASTFAGRVITSTLSDLHSGVVGAIGALKGPLHGGANEEAMKMLLEVGSVEKAEAWVLNALATKKKIMGFGHRAYKTGDPRAFLLFEQGKALGEKLGQPKWHQMAEVVAQVMLREKNIHPNVDFPTAYVYYLMGLPIDIYTPIFALSRVAGWSAHIIEQLANNRLIRPKALYEGPAYQPYVAIAER